MHLQTDITISQTTCTQEETINLLVNQEDMLLNCFTSPSILHETDD